MDSVIVLMQQRIHSILLLMVKVETFLTGFILCTVMHSYSGVVKASGAQTRGQAPPKGQRGNPSGHEMIDVAEKKEKQS